MHKHQLSALTIAAILIFSVIPLVEAGQIRRADIFANEDIAGVEFVAQRWTTIDYSSGGKIKDILRGVNERYVLKANESTPDIHVLKEAINKALIKANSPAKVKEVKELTYTVALRDDNGVKALLDQTVNLKVILTDIVMQEAVYQQPALMDLNWRGFKIDERVPLTFSTDGETITLDVNNVRGYFDARYPEVSSILSRDSNIASIINEPLLNFEEIGKLPITQWHKLINPNASMEEAQRRFGLKAEAPAVTVVSAGEGSIREGIHKEKELTATANIDGNTYRIDTKDPAIAATLDIYYWAEPIRNEHGDAARVYLQPPQELLQQAATGNFPLMVLLVFAGMMGAIAGFVIWRANKS